MSSSVTHRTWSNKRVSGVQKLLLLALAECATPKGEAQVSLRDLAAMCGLSKTRVDDLLKSLIKAGEVRILSAGSGRGNPAKYWITGGHVQPKCPVDEVEPHPVYDLPAQASAEDSAAPEIAAPEPPTVQLEAVNVKSSEPAVLSENTTKNLGKAGRGPSATQADVDALLRAAGVKPPPEQPFFWNRAEHRADLAQWLEEMGIDMRGAIKALQAARENGRKMDRPPRRIADVMALAGRVR